MLRRLLPAGAAVRIERDPNLDDVDRYGRQLRYVIRGGRNVNLVLVRQGAASVWFFDGERGRHADALLRAAERAAAQRRGAWGACQAELTPDSSFTTLAKTSEPDGQGVAPVQSGSCDPAYPGVCIPPPPPDLDCDDVRYTNFAVRPPDPHAFDGEGDGRACES